MSFADETPEPIRPTHLLLRCRRCGATHAIETADTERHLIDLVATNRTTMTVRCSDMALAVAEVVGVGPGQWPPKLPPRPEPEVVFTEKRARR